jgi:hypothetical protein
VLRGAGIVLLIAGLLSVPGLLRLARRRRRLGRLDRDGPAGAWQELVDTAIDLGLETGRGRSLRGIEAVLAEQAGAAPGARAALARLRAAYERQAYSRTGAAVSASDVMAVVEALGAQVTPSRRITAALAPRSLVGTMRVPRLAFGWSPPGSG